MPLIRKKTSKKEVSNLSLDLETEKPKIFLTTQKEPDPPEVQSEVFRKKMQKLTKVSNSDTTKADENINEQIKKNMANDYNEYETEKSKKSSMSNNKAIKVITNDQMNEYLSNDRSIPNESFFQHNIEDINKIEEEIQNEKKMESHEHNLDRKKSYKADGKNEKAISSVFNINNSELMTDFDKSAVGLTKFELYKNE